jgi:phosphoribosylaminoimidazole (AIR) synthetase
MGIGLTAIVGGGQADDVLKAIRAAGHRAWVIGDVIKGRGQARVE